MPKRDRLYCLNMRDYAAQAMTIVADKQRHDFDGDPVLRLALTHLLQIIGEAARRVSQETKDANPEIPWPRIIGMRHRIVHDYLRINEEVVWQAVTQELEPLIARLDAVLGTKPDGG